MKAARILPLAALVAVLVGAAGCGTDKLALGPAGSASVWGTVTDRASGAPVAGASVWTPPASAATTDQDGRYSMTIQWQHGDPTVDAGQGCAVSVVVTKAGYVSTYPKIECMNGTSYQEDIRMDAVR